MASTPLPPEPKSGSAGLCSAVQQIVDAGPGFKSIKGNLRTEDIISKTYSLTIDTSAFVNAAINEDFKTTFEGLLYKGHLQTDCFERYQEVLAELKTCDVMNGVEPKESALSEYLQVNGFGVRSTFDLGSKGTLVVVARKETLIDNMYETTLTVYH